MEEFLETIEKENLDQINERIAKLDIEVRSMSNVNEVEKATEKKTALLERKKVLEDLNERKDAAIALNENSDLGKVVERTMAKTEKVDTQKEYRNAYLKQLRNIELNDVEKRAMAVSNAGGTIPTTTQNEIIRKIKEFAPILSEITLLQVEGNVTFAVEGTITDAKIHTENANIAGDSDTLVPVTLSGFEITKLVQISKSVSKMSVDAFESWLTTMIAEKVAEKIANLILFGTGTNQPKGIDKITWDAKNSVTIASGKTTTNADVQKLVALLPGAYDKNAKIVMSKKTLFNEFMPLQDNSKNSIVREVAGSYFIYGYEVLKDDRMALGSAILGDFSKVVGNLQEDCDVVGTFDINTNSYKFLGSAIFDSKVGIDNAFVKLIKATA